MDVVKKLLFSGSIEQLIVFWAILIKTKNNNIIKVHTAIGETIKIIRIQLFKIYNQILTYYVLKTHIFYLPVSTVKKY